MTSHKDIRMGITSPGRKVTFTNTSDEDIYIIPKSDFDKRIAQAEREARIDELENIYRTFNVNEHLFKQVSERLAQLQKTSEVEYDKPCTWCGSKTPKPIWYNGLGNGHWCSIKCKNAELD